MAIAYDTSGSQSGDGVASRTVSLAATGSDRIAIIAARWFTTTTIGNPTITVNGSGTGVVQIGTELQYSGDDRQRMALYYFLAPSTSSVAYLATWSGTIYSVALGVATYTGVHQTTPITGGPNTNEASSAAPSITVSSATGELVVAALGCGGTANSGTADGAQSSRVLLSNWGGTGSVFGISDKAGAASVTESWTIDSAIWQVAAARLAAAGGGSSAAPLGAAYYYYKN
jgi:hypothetical protein